MDVLYGWNDKFDLVYYFFVRVLEIFDIYIYLKDDIGLLVIFIDLDVWVILYMYRYFF